jgi:hypothetical protein
MMTGKRIIRAGLALALACASALAAGCASTHHPGPIGASELSEAQTFPYYRVYWVGSRFEGQSLVAVDGRKSYNSSVGDGVYYGDCISGKSLFGGGSCTLPLRVATLIYTRHDNKPLGAQRNILIRGVPAAVYDEGRSLELYTGRLAIDVFSDTFAGARAAALSLRPMNARGSASEPLPPPVYCPGLFGPQELPVQRAMLRLPGHACQRAAAELAYGQRLKEKPSGSAKGVAKRQPPAPDG